jgi:ribosome-binding factor A
MSDRIKRLESLFLAEIASFISRYHSDKFEGIITVSAVKITKNLQSAKVYYSLIGGNIDAGKQVIDKIKKQIIHYLAKRLRLKRIPSLYFEFDQTAKTAASIENIFKKLEDEKK